MMMTSDIALKVDPNYRAVCEKFLADFGVFTLAFSKAWYKLTHRDMGPRERYLGPEARNDDDLMWQDPIPPPADQPIGDVEIDALKQAIRLSGLSASDLVFTAFSTASTHRNSDKRGGANGGRLALSPQKDWVVNLRTVPVVATLKTIMAQFNDSTSHRAPVSLADLIVLGGCVGVEVAAADAGVPIDVPFSPGRRDTTQELTDVEMFEWLKPVVDGFRNYVDPSFAAVSSDVSPEELFLDKAQLLSLTAPEWTALTGGLRVLGANHDRSSKGVFTDRVGVLTNDFFKVLTSTNFEWKKLDEMGTSFALHDRATGTIRHLATRCDLVFGSNSQLRAVAEIYASDDGQTRFVQHFVKAWDKLMMLDRYDAPTSA